MASPCVVSDEALDDSFGRTPYRTDHTRAYEGYSCRQDAFSDVLIDHA